LVTATWIIIFILILSVVIFIHELGHFLAARRAGIFVEEFALGMGPKIIQLKGKKRSLPKADGEEGDVTLYTLRILPIGGYCKMRGQDEDVPEDPEAMNNKSVKARLLVIAGGSLMNFLLAFVLFFLLIMLNGHTVAEVMHLQTGAPGYQAGLQVGDRITHINGARIGVFEDLHFMLDMSGGQELDVRVNRGGERVDLQITPMLNENDRYIIGFHGGRRHGLLDERPEDPATTFRRVTVTGGLVAASETILSHVRTPFRLLSRLISGQQMPEGGGLMGPIGIAEQVVELGHIAEEFQIGFLDQFLMILSLTALLNAALGVMNLLPIPALDGARLVFLVIEGIRRKPVPPEREAMVHLVGIVAILALAVFIAYRDIARLL